MTPALLLALALILTALPLPASANTSGDYTFTVIDEAGKTARLNRIDNASGAVDIPAVIDGYTITEIENTIYGSIFVASDYESNNTVTSVTIPDSVTNIGGWAFYYCTGLTSVSIGSQVTTIGTYAFLECTGLSSVNIPDSVNTIDRYAFCRCPGLTSITIPSSVTIIGDGAFHSCTGLTSIAIPESITSIAGELFYDCTALSSVSIPDSVTSIGGSAFSGCTSLTGITIPDGVQAIESFTFERCSGLTGITIPDSVKSIGYYSFSGCTALSSITIPDSVTSIGGSAFAYCSSLTGVNIGNGIAVIDHYTFSGCSGLSSITIPDSVTSIGINAFSYCTSLASITIPDSVTTIKDHAFYNCTSLDCAYFYGNAPATFGSYVFDGTAPGFTIYYIEGKTGWTNPWNGYPTATFVPQGAAPGITKTDPADGEEGVAIAGNIIISFSEDVEDGSDYDNITIKDAGENSVSVSKSVYDSTLALDPTDNLMYNMVYTVCIPAGAVNNMAGVPLAEDCTFSFTMMTLGEAEDTVKEYIQNLADCDFDGPADERKNALSNAFNAVDNMLNAGNYRGAVKILRNDIRSKADGMVDGKPGNDWIVNQTAQQNICDMIDDIIIYLQTLE